jgi:hypothetical protein
MEELTHCDKCHHPLEAHPGTSGWDITAHCPLCNEWYHIIYGDRMGGQGDTKIQYGNIVPFAYNASLIHRKILNIEKYEHPKAWRELEKVCELCLEETTKIVLDFSRAFQIDIEEANNWLISNGIRKDPKNDLTGPMGIHTTINKKT